MNGPPQGLTSGRTVDFSLSRHVATSCNRSYGLIFIWLLLQRFFTAPMFISEPDCNIPDIAGLCIMTVLGRYFFKILYFIVKINF